MKIMTFSKLVEDGACGQHSAHMSASEHPSTLLLKEALGCLASVT